jgi:hypothetical protein
VSCWAQSLGGCGNKLSREHIVSASLFTANTIKVQGFPWCRDAQVEIGVSGLTAKILCAKHNNDLSPLDEIAGKAFETMRAVRDLGETRKKLKQRIWNVKQFKVDGALLERWFLKTLVNIACGGECPIGRDSDTDGRPSNRLVRMAYGQERFENRAGLYLVARKGMTLNLEDRLQCLPLIKERDNRVEGALFTFFGLAFLLFLEAEGPPEPLTGIFLGTEHIGDASLLFHGTTLNTRVGRYKSHVLNVSW